MEERGHLGKKYNAESQEPAADLWGRVEAGIPGKRGRRGILWWWGLGGAFLLMTGWWATRLHESPALSGTPGGAGKGPQTEKVAHEGTSPANKIPQQKATPAPEVTRPSLPQPVPPSPRSYAKAGPSETIKSAENQHDIEFIGKKPVRRKSNARQAIASGISVVHPAYSKRKQKAIAKEPGHSVDVSVTDNLAAAARVPQADKLNPAPVIDQREGKTTLNTIGQETGTEPLAKEKPVVEKETREETKADAPLPGENSKKTAEEPASGLGKSALEPNKPLEVTSAIPPKFEASPSLHQDSLVRAQFPDAATSSPKTDSVLADSSRKAVPARWHFGLSGGVFYVSKLTSLNQDPEGKRLSLANQNTFGSDRLAFTGGFTASYSVSGKLAIYGLLGLVYMEDQSTFQIRGDSVVEYAERIDAAGNRFVRPVYQEHKAISTSQNLYAHVGTGFVVTRLAGPLGFRLGVGANVLLWERRKITPSSALDPGSKNVVWAPSVHVGLPLHLAVWPKASLVIEPECRYFLTPVFMPGKGTDTRPTLLGIKLGWVW